MSDATCTDSDFQFEKVFDPVPAPLCVSPFGGVTAEQIHRDFPLETSKEV
jgi:hypothetical protein